MWNINFYTHPWRGQKYLIISVVTRSKFYCAWALPVYRYIPVRVYTFFFFFIRISCWFMFSGTVCIPLNHLCGDIGGGHLKVPATHWKQVKKHEFDNSAGEVSVNTTFTNAATGSETTTMAGSATTGSSSSNNSCNNSVRRWTVREENASSASWRHPSSWKKDEDHEVPGPRRRRRSSTSDIATLRKSAVAQQIWIWRTSSSRLPRSLRDKITEWIHLFCEKTLTSGTRVATTWLRTCV